MNCERIRKELSDVVAAGESELAATLTQHLKSCEACRAYYEAEAQLLLSIDAGLGSLVNQPVPPSLLPRVREQLQEPAPRRAWLFALLPATVVLVVVALVALPRLRQTSIPAGQPITSIPSNVPETVKAHPETTKVEKAQARYTKHPSLRTTRAHSPLEHKAAAPEVIVGPEESRGLMLLASTVVHEPALGKALLNPVAPAAPFSKPIVSQEIAPLEVASLEIKPIGVEDH